MDHPSKKITLGGAVSIGAGMMLGTAAFALPGQVAQAAKGAFPIVFIMAAVVTMVASYSYVKLADRYAADGGMAVFLTKAFGIGDIAATLTLANWVALAVGESLVARTFGIYLTKLFGLDNPGAWAVIAGVGLLIVSYAINASGPETLSKTEFPLLVIKLVGLLLVAGTGLWVATWPSYSNTELTQGPVDGFIAGVAIAMLAYRGYTAIPAAGPKTHHPDRTIGRAIIIAIGICALVYVGTAMAIRGNLTIPQIEQARDFALAEAAVPVFGVNGFRLVAVLAVIATGSRALAMTFVEWRTLDRMEKDREVPDLSFSRYIPFGSTPLLVPTVVAIVLTVGFDLNQIAAIGSFVFLCLDGTLHFGHLRYLRGQTGANPWLLALPVITDAVLFVGLAIYKVRTDKASVIAFVVLLVVVGISERWYLSDWRRRKALGGAAAEQKQP